jgi:hypothetical protein
MNTIDVMKQTLAYLENGHFTYETKIADDLRAAIKQEALNLKAENARELGLDYESPPEAQTEAEKTAYAFGWWKAMEYARQNGVITSQPVPVKTYSGGKAWPVQTVVRMEALKDAFFEGFTSVETYNDKPLNSPEEAWAKYCQPVTTPVAHNSWIGLTDKEAQWIYDSSRTPSGMMEMVEAKLKEKNSKG